MRQAAQIHFKRFSISLLLVCGLCSLGSGAVQAVGGVSQGYTTSVKGLVPGTVMGLSTNGTATPATAGNSYQLLGLVAKTPLLSLNDGTQQVQIVISGSSSALVSTINGDIKVGDKITASPIQGVGMKASDPGQIVGTAQSDLSKSHMTTQTITDKAGHHQTIKLGTVELQVSVGYYSGSNQQGALGSVVPPFLLRTANALSGEEVSPLRVLIALLAFILGFVIAGVMLQSAVRANIIAVGRNPLAKKALRRELLDVSVTAVGVLLVTALVVYIVIKI